MTREVSADFVGLQQALAGRYSLERELGRGGMGVVYLAHEVALDRPVALKLLPAELAADPAVKERFLQEARTAAKLSHPNIVPIFTVDEVGSYVFFAMALVDGETLGDRVRARGPLADQAATKLVREIAWALGYAHASGVVHRDVKPDNILLEHGTGRALVTDFGIAQVGPPDEGAQRPPGPADHVQGTAEFMSPEQATGAPVDHRSDLYALGALGFFIVTGRAPFEDASPAVVLARHATEAPPPVAKVAPHVPTDLARTIDRLLRKEPERRFPDGAAVAEALSHGSALDRAAPVPLRVFLRHLRELSRVTPGFVAFMLFLGFPFLSGIFFSLGLRSVNWALAALLVVPVGTVGYLWDRIRRVIKAGHTIEDVRLALQQDVAQRNEEFRFDVGERVTGLDRALEQVVLGGLSLGAATLALAGLAGVGSLFPVSVGSILVGLGAALMRSSRASRRGDVAGERWLKFFEGRVGKWLFRAGALGAGTPDTVAAGTYRPTEMAISISAARLFEELPKESRKLLSGLPETVGRLEADARTLRQQVAELDGVLSELGEDARAPGAEATTRVRMELEETKAEAERRLREVFGALETIRLGLLRMHSGERVLPSVTMELETARSLSGDLASLLEGHREVERMLSDRRATGRTDSVRPVPDGGA